MSPQKPSLPRGASIDGSQTVIEGLKSDLPGEDIGSPRNRSYGFSNWKNKQGDWKAVLVETHKGFYFSVENIVLG